MVKTTAGEDLPIWAEADRSYLVGMPLQDFEGLAGVQCLDIGDIPQADGVISTATGQGLSIRAETDRVDLVSMS